MLINISSKINCNHTIVAKWLHITKKTTHEQIMCTNTYWRLQQEIRYLATYWTVQCQMYSGGWGCSMDTIPASSLRFLFTVSYVVRRLIFFTAFLLRGKYTGHAGFPRRTMEFVVCVDARLFGQNIAQTIELPVNWDTMSRDIIAMHCRADRLISSNVNLQYWKPWTTNLHFYRVICLSTHYKFLLTMQYYINCLQHFVARQ